MRDEYINGVIPNYTTDQHDKVKKTEDRRAYMRDYRRRNADKYRDAQRRYRERKGEAYLEWRREYDRKWRDDNREVVREYNKYSREKHGDNWREHRREYAAKWRRENPEKSRAIQERYRQKRKERQTAEENSK